MSSETKIYREDQNGIILGLNTEDDPTNLLPGQSPYMLNMDYAGTKKVQTRFGYELATEIPAVTGGFKGAMPYYRTYGTNSGDYLLLFHSNGYAYSITQADLEASVAPTSLGQYFAGDSGRVRGAVLNNIALFGSVSNISLQKWEGTGALQNLLGSPVKASFFAVWRGKLYGAGVLTAPTNIYWTADDNPESGFDGTNYQAVNLGDGDDLTALIPHNDALIVLKERSKHAMNIVFDDSALASAPTFMPITDSSGGCVATDTAVPVYGNLYYLSSKGFQKYGTSAEGIDRRQPNSMSFLIRPTVNNINLEVPSNCTAVYHDEKYMCAVPMGQFQTVSNVFVWNEIYQAWTLYDNIPSNTFIVFKSSKNREDLYFTSNSEGKVFKMNTTFSDNGFGYERTYRTRTWRLGQRTRWIRLILNGSKVFGKDINLEVSVDDVKESTTITDDDLITSTLTGGYIGDNYLGDAYVGSAVEGDVMYKWTKYYDFPATISEGRDMYFELNSSEDGAGWSFDLDYSVKVEHLNPEV